MWKLKQNREFIVKSYYYYMVGRESNRVANFSAYQIWKGNTPPIVAFFAWEAGRERILAIDKLITRGKIMVNVCYLSKKAAESYNHVLLWCLIAYELWSMIYSLLGINWIIAGTVEDEIWAWEGLCKKRKFVKLILLTIFWVLWKEGIVGFF